MDKPLSETHPTLCAAIGQAGHRPPVSWWLIKPIQETTVDKAEHERITKEYYDERFDLIMNIGELKGDVERLKKELEAVKRYGKFVELKPLLDGAYQAQRNEFIAEGERRAMQRVKEAAELHSNVIKSEGAVTARKRIDYVWFFDELGSSDKDDDGHDADCEGTMCWCKQRRKREDDEVQP